MSRLTTFLLTLPVSLAFASVAQADSHGHHDQCDPHAPAAPLLSVPDVNGDGAVDGDDVSDVATRVGSVAGDDTYWALYDLDADGDVDQNDVTTVAQFVGTSAPLVDSEVANVAMAVEQYRYAEDAQIAGFVPGTQYFEGHGYHWIDLDRRLDAFEMYNPAGLNYDADGNLIAVFWYVEAELWGHDAPAAFTGHEDMWHHHKEVCAWNLGATNDEGELDWSYPFFIEDITSGYGFPNCDYAEGYLRSVGLLQTPTGDPGVSLQSDMFHMLHLWVGDLNPCGRFAGTHPDA